MDTTADTRAEISLHLRGLRTAVACWEAYAGTIAGGTLHRLPGIDVAVFTDGPEREFFNNAVPAHDLDAAQRRAAVDALVSTYADAGITSYAAWVHETDRGMLDELTSRDFRHQETTWSMGRTLDADPPSDREDVDPGSWAEYLRVLELPAGLLEDADPADFDIAVGRVDGAAVAAGMAFDHEADTGIYNVGTLKRARRRGLGSAVVARLLREATTRGSTTATLQSTEMARGVYAGQGFADLGRILELGPPPTP
ncbi:MAG: GNAT family N-acetyltransferase [Nocardioides sp.]